MFDDLILVHRKGAEPFRIGDDVDGGWCVWQTCLRKIAIGSVHASVHAMDDIRIESGDDVLCGADAYRFCLEVICGLHSPLIGETEVFGQFKATADVWNPENGHFAFDLKRFVRALIEDAKRVRSAHLSDLGSQSYGSLLRKELKGTTEIHVLGAGHLAGEVLPWICKDGNRVHVHVRSLERATALREKFPAVRFHLLGAKAPLPLDGALVVAAPVASAWVGAWLSASGAAITRIADLRSDSETDVIRYLGAEAIALGELMRRISANQEALEERRRLALDLIEKTVAARARHIEYRPFGWEDVCA